MNVNPIIKIWGGPGGQDPPPPFFLGGGGPPNFIKREKMPPFST